MTRLRRGVYARSGEAAITEHHDLALVASRVTHGVIVFCALRFHQLGTQSPAEVWVAIDTKARKPRSDVPPTKFVRFSGRALAAGIDEPNRRGHRPHHVARQDGGRLFQVPQQIGLDVALEALREIERSRRRLDDLLQAAQAVRVAEVMRPYLEALTT